MAYQPVDIGSAPNDGTGDPIRDAFDKCNDNFVELYAGLTGLLDFKGSTDCSANPNYPAASKGDFYVVSVAGKIGGASGIDVEVGDAYFAEADNAGGTQASVGTDWSVIQGNIVGSTITELDDIPDVNAPSPSAGDVLTWDDTPGEWVASPPPGGGAFSIDDATDVDTTSTPPNDGDVLTFDNGSGDWIPAAPSGGDLGVLHVQDQKASGTNGGGFTSGAWRTRDLNTAVVNTISGASLSTNQITLPAGTYDIVASCQGFSVDQHQAKWVNVTDTADVVIGLNARSRSSSATDGHSPALLQTRFTIAGTKVFELQNRCLTTKATDGFGQPTSWGTEVYADVFIKRVA